MYCVYVIECETPNHYYIGLTRSYNHRIRNHMRGKGARFTQVHGFKKVIAVKSHESEKCAKESERELTEQYIQTYSIENVAGAGKSQVLKGKLRKANMVSEPILKNVLASSSKNKERKKAYIVAQIRQRYSRAYEKWNAAEDLELIVNYQAGLSTCQLAERHQRKRGAIRSRLKKLGLQY
jgi:predicted GIY-YIG superfamily endonuclease